MKTQILLATMLMALSVSVCAQSDNEQVSAACMKYIEGFYEGDQAKLKECLQPSLNKFGFWKSDGKYSDQIKMSYEAALDYARNVKEKQEYPDDDAPKIVEVLDVLDYIAVAKVTAWWGEDYLTLSKRSGKWMIEQVIWQGPYTGNQ